MEFTVLGIDPGINSTGYGLIRFISSSDFAYIDSGTINPKRSDNMELRLSCIFQGITEIIKKHSPRILAIEKIFAGKNIHSEILLAYSKSAVLVAAGIGNIPVREFTPTKVKKYISGYGLAGKPQIKFIISKILRINDIKINNDASDALAISFCGGLDHFTEMRKKRFTT